MRKLDNSLGIFEQIISSGGNFIFAILLSKLLSPDDFGSYSVIWMIIISLSSIINAWFSSPLLSIGPSLIKNEENKFINDLTRQILILQFVLAFFLLLVLGVFNKMLELEDLILVSTCIPFFLYDFLRRVAIIKGKLKTLVTVGGCLQVFLIAGCMYTSNGDFLIVSKIIALSYIAASFYLLMIFRPVIRLRCDSSELSSGNLRSIESRRFDFSKWLSYSSVLQFISGNAVTIFSAGLLPIAEVGLLRLAQTFVSLFNPVLIYMDNHARPYFARILRDSGGAVFNFSFKKMALKFVSFGFVVFSSVGVLGVFMIDEFYPNLYDTNIYGYFVLFLLLAFLGTISFIFRMRFLVLEKNKIIFRSYLVASISSISLFYPMVLNFGGYGVVGTLIITQTIILVILSGVFQRIMGSLSLQKVKL